MDDLMRHILACRAAVLPGSRLRLDCAGQAVGLVLPDDAAALCRLGAERTAWGVALEADALQPAARALAEAGRFVWRGEDFDVFPDAGGRAVARVDRGALPTLGIAATGAHLNGLVRRGDGWHLWVARRSAAKLLDPGKLDHLAAGGVPAGLDAAQTLVKEAEEEAGIPPALSAQARQVATIGYALDRPEGLRRDRIHCFDLVLPDNFQPVAVDGEVESFALWPLDKAISRVRHTDDFKFNVNLALIDLGLRLGAIVGAEAAGLRAALEGS